MGNKITWGDMKALSDALDGIASDMNIQGYSSLADDTSTPFSLSGMVAASCTYKFSVESSAGAPKTLANWAENLSVPSPLDTLCSNGDLYFVNDPDGCWCKTIFKVTTDGSNYQFQAVNDISIGCCQTLDVPSDGSLLDRTQYFIPPGPAAGFNRGVDDQPDLGTVYRDAIRCVADSGNGAHFTFSQGSVNTHYDISEAGRDMSGNLTWPIRAKWFDSLWDQIEKIVTGSCGAWDDSVYGDGDDEYLDAGCVVDMADLIYTLNKEGTLGNNPGCFPDADTLPWNSTTCGGNTCGDTGSPLVYQETIDQLWSIINSIEAKLQPYKSGCCATWQPWVETSETLCCSDRSNCKDSEGNDQDPECAGYPSTMTLPTTIGDMGGECALKWQLREMGADRHGAVVYLSGYVDGDGNLLKNDDSPIPSSWTAGVDSPCYCYPAYMELQIGIVDCSNNSVKWP